MGKLQQSNLQNAIVIAALLELLEDKGVVTEEEFKQKYDEAKKLLLDSILEDVKKTF